MTIMHTQHTLNDARKIWYEILLCLLMTLTSFVILKPVAHSMASNNFLFAYATFSTCKIATFFEELNPELFANILKH